MQEKGMSALSLKILLGMFVSMFAVMVGFNAKMIQLSVQLRTSVKELIK